MDSWLHLPVTALLSLVMAPYLVPSNYGPDMGRTYKDLIEVPAMKPLTKERYEYACYCARSPNDSLPER